MHFKLLLSWGFIGCLILSLLACSNSKNETTLVDLHTAAAQDVISLEFAANTQTVLSINSDTAFSVRGLKTDGSSVSLSSQIEWSLSNGAQSSISKQGLLKAAASAETFTLTATLGMLSTSIDIRISDAKFDQVVILNNDPVTLQMCQSKIINPIGKYIDTAGNEEIRPLDNNIIGNISWIIRNASDNSISQSAFITTSGNTTTLYSLAAGDLIIQAQATSEYTGNLTTSADMNQNIGNALDSIKLCSASASDYSTCSVTNSSVEQDQKISFIAVGNYSTSNGSALYQNISRNVKWGLSNNNISAIFSDNLQQLDVTGEVEVTTSSLTAACGNIQQSISGIDISQGIILDTAVSCDTDCLATTASIDITRFNASSLSVTANGAKLTDSVALNLNSAPNEIKLVITATYSNKPEQVITDDSSLDYTIIDINGQNKVIEQKANTLGTFTVLASGTAKIQLNYRGKVFIVLISIP